jgi:hypothetical protein
LYANGTKIVLPACAYLPIKVSSSVTSSTPYPGFPTNSWVEQAEDSDSSGFVTFTGYWGVPSSPTTTTDGQTIFLWIGEDANSAGSSDLIQPVLQWGSTAAGGGTYYAIASWYVYNSGLSVVYSTLKTASWGDVIEGSMSFQGCGGRGTCNTYVTTTDTTTSTSTTYNAPVGKFDYGFIVLEVDNVVSCNDYPGYGVTYFYSLAQTDSSGSHTPSWSGSVFINDGCGESVSVSSSSSLYLYY